MRYTRADRVRLMIAEEAARLIYDEGVQDYLTAKRKASQRLGIRQKKGHQPTNQEIQDALFERKSLFSDDQDENHLAELRELAVNAMTLVGDFAPLLTGSVLDGSAGEYSPVTLHLFADSPESVMFFMEDQNIPIQMKEQRVRIGKKTVYFPMLTFFAGDVLVELLIFSLDEMGKRPPLCPVSGGAMQRANLHKVKKLIDAA